MCGILVSTDQNIDLQAFQKGLQTLQRRGPDESRIEMTGGGILGFQRLAVMDLSEAGMQPFHHHHSALVCNGEIYGWRPLKQQLRQKYEFISDSDCEILLPLYEELGNEMFVRLDGEFALVLYDHRHQRWVAARDPIGIRPLFYGTTRQGAIAFGSTARSLQPFCTGIAPFPPGHYYCDGQFHCYNDIAQTQHDHNESLEVLCQNIHDRLIDGVLKRMDADAPVGYLLSGGLDSSLVCAIAQKHSAAAIRTFAIGMDKDAIDLKYARQVAEAIGSDHTEVIIHRQQVLDALPEVIQSLETWDITTIRASLGMALLCREIHRTTGIKVLFTGEISDELFGYKYTDFAPSAEQFQKEAQKRIRELYMYDVLRADRCISDHGMEGRVPFGDLSFVRYVMDIDPACKMNTYGIGKYLLRKAFEADGLLPRSILYRDKAAFSDAVGHSLVEDLQEYAGELYSDLMFHQRCRQYAWCPPYTKESLLYRDLFEQFYPGMGKLIAAYWLPNQSWTGCQVSDPSARVLSNYGKSGE